MEYSPAFRLRDKTTGKHDLRHMTKHEPANSFKRVWYGNTVSTQNWLNSVFYSIKEIETKKSKSYNCGKLRELFFDRQDKTRQDLHVQEVMPSRGWTRQESLHLYHFNFPAKKEYSKK